MTKNIANILNKEVDVTKIKNPRLKQIVESYRTKTGFLFLGIFGSSKSEHHKDYEEHSDNTSSYYYDGFPEPHIHSDDMSHTDYDDYSEYKEYSDHTDHTDKPHSEYSEYSESEYHTDSRSHNYR